MNRFRDDSHEDEREEQVRRFPELFTSDCGGTWDPEPPLFPEIVDRVTSASLHGVAKPEEVPSEPTTATDDGDDLFSRSFRRGFES